MKLKSLIFVALAVVIVLFTLSCNQVPPVTPVTPVTRDTKTTELAEINLQTWVVDSFKISPDNRTFVYTNNIDKQQAVLVNGVEGKRYDEIAAYEVIFSSDGKHMAYPARTGDSWYIVMDGQEIGPYEKIERTFPPFFSPDGSKLIYIVNTGDKLKLVVNGKEEGPYNEVKFSTSVFSEDSQRYAYLARNDDKWSVVIDGQQGDKYDNIYRFTFSPDGKHSGYNGSIGGIGYVILDGKKTPQYDEVSEVLFSSDSSKYAYAAKTGNDHFMVVNGEKGKSYIDIQAPVFSPDSQRLVYAAQLSDGNWVMVIDGEETEPQPIIGMPFFSPDSKHIVYYMYDGQKVYVFYDGVKSPGYNEVGTRSLTFSPDSQRLAYVILSSGQIGEEDESTTPGANSETNSNTDEAATTERYAIIVDGIQSKEYHGVGAPLFSKDSKHLFYLALDEDGKAIAVLDGKEMGKYDDFATESVRFSPDSKNIIYVAKMGTSIYTYVNGEPGTAYDGVYYFNNGDIVFDTDNSFHYIALKGSKTFLVEETIIAK